MIFSKNINKTDLPRVWCCVCFCLCSFAAILKRSGLPLQSDFRDPTKAASIRRKPASDRECVQNRNQESRIRNRIRNWNPEFEKPGNVEYEPVEIEKKDIFYFILSTKL